MALSERTKFWLKVGLAITFPLWALPAACGLLAGAFGVLTWNVVTAGVEALTDEDEA